MKLMISIGVIVGGLLGGWLGGLLDGVICLASGAFYWARSDHSSVSGRGTKSDKITCNKGQGRLVYTDMAANLVIVESPAKAKTIEKFLGKDYQVKSSFGHIRDLPKKGLNIDIAKDFEPHYEVSADKRKTVSELKTAAKGKEVWLASDEDREGRPLPGT